MSDAAPASSNSREAGHHDLQEGPRKQLQAPRATSDLQDVPQPSNIGQVNGFAHRNNGDTNVDKSDSEAETVVLSGKEEGLDHNSRKAIKLENPIRPEADVIRPSDDLAVVQDQQQDAGMIERVRRSPLKRKRTMPDHGYDKTTTSDNSSNLSSTVSSPVPQAKSSKTTGSGSNRSRSSPPFDEIDRGQEQSTSKTSFDKGNNHDYRREGQGDRASEPAKARKRRDTRSATHHGGPSHRSESPPSLNNNRASMQSNHPHPAYSGVTKRRKVPAPLHVDRRRKPSEDMHPDSDDDSSVHSHPHLQKLTSGDNNALSPAKMISNKKNRDRSGQTLLARACRSGDVVESRKWLQERPQDLNIADYAENTPLQIAALEGHIEVVRLLLEAGCDIDCRNIDMETPLIDAVENGHLDVVELLLEAGVDPRQPNAKGQEPLDLVNPDHDDAEEIREALQASKKEKPLLRRPSEDYNRQQGVGSRDAESTPGAVSGVSPITSTRSPPPLAPAAKRRTARSQVTDESLLWVNPTAARLREAAGKGDRKIVQHILGMDPRADTGSVLAAARGGHEDVLNLLLAMGKPDPDPDPESLTSKDYKPAYSTPLLAAIGRGKISIIQLLIQQAGFDPTRRLHNDMTYYEIAKERQGTDWQKEYDMLKEAYDNFAQHGGRKSNNNSPRRVRVKRADSAKSVSHRSSSSHGAWKTRKRGMLGEDFSDGAKPDSTSKRAAPKSTGEINNRKSPSLASDHDSGSLRLHKSKNKDSGAGSEKALLTSKRADTSKPKRRLMSGNEYKSDQDMKRRASLATDIDVHRAPLSDKMSSHDNLQRRVSDTSDSVAVDTSEEMSTARSEMAKKRHRTSISPQDSKLDITRPVDPKQKKRQRVDSHGNAINQDRDRSFRPGAPATVANMIADPPAPAPATVSQGTAPVAFMGSNVVSPATMSPTEFFHQPPIKVSGNSIAQALPQPVELEKPRAPKGREEEMVEQRNSGQDREREAMEVEDGAVQEKTQKRRSSEAEREKLMQAEREDFERKSRIARQEEEARLEERRQAAEAERLALIEREQEDARVARLKRDEEIHQRRIEQERLRREDQERKRKEVKERENLRRMKWQEEQERQRLQSLPNGLKRAAELGPEEARNAENIKKWLPLNTVTTRELNCECEPMIAEEKWIANIQAAPILAISDLDLSQYTAWTRIPATINHRGSLWRLLRNIMSLYIPDGLRSSTDRYNDDIETEPKFAALSNVFWIKLSDFMDIVPRHQHLAGLKISTREMESNNHPFGPYKWTARTEEYMKQGPTSPGINGTMMNGFP